MPKAFRDGDEFESAIEFPEEGHVAFEDKGCEVMAAGDGEQSAQQSKDVLGNAGLPPLDDGGGDADVHCWRRNNSRRAMRRTLRTTSRGLVKRRCTPRF